MNDTNTAAEMLVPSDSTSNDETVAHATNTINGNNTVEDMKDQRLKQSIQTIMNNLDRLKSRMIDNQNTSKEIFEKYIESINNKINEQKTINNNVNNKNVPVETDLATPATASKATMKEIDDEITNKQKEELESYHNNVKLELEQKLNAYQKENIDLNEKMGSLQKIILLLEKENNSNRASYSDIKSSIEQIIEKGRIQLKTLNNERNQSEQYKKRLIEQQDANQMLRKENSALKSKIQEMLILLQCASQEDDPNQLVIDELIAENNALRTMLDISKSFGGISLSSLPSDNLKNNNNNTENNNHHNNENGNNNHHNNNNNILENENNNKEEG